MEEKTARERLAAWFYRIWRRGVMRSGLVTGLFLAVVAMAFVLGYQQHQQGNFHKLKERMADERPQVVELKAGGLAPLEVTRARLMEDAEPEFMSVTMLPGRGMNVLQIRAYIPGKGEVNLLASPSVAGAAAAMTGKGADVDGQASLTMGGAFEVPWAGRIWSSEAMEWRGQSIPSPDPADGGLMLQSAADSSDAATLPDGGQAEATFHGFDGKWLSKTEVTVTALLSSHTVDFTVTAHNTGAVSEPIGIGWAPRFAIAEDAISQIRLRVPAESVVEMGGRNDGAPTGKLLPVAGSEFDYTAREGTALPEKGLDQCFADLEEDVLDDGPVAELSDGANGYRLRLTALSPEIRAMRVSAPEGRSYVLIGPEFNYPDPLGREWGKAVNTGMVVLAPGQSVEWKVRLEILPLSSGENGSAM